MAKPNCAQPLATDDDETIEVSEIDGEVRERIEIRSRARMASYVTAAADQQPLAGAEHELSAAYGLPAGHMPIEMLLPGNREGGEVRAVTPGVVAPGASAGISPVIFESTAAASVGVTFPVVASGEASFPVMSTPPTATPVAQSAAAPNTAGAFRLDTRTPTRVSGQFEVEVEDIALLPGMEEALRGSIGQVIAEAVDEQVISGNDSGANLNGLFQQAANATVDSAVETFATGVARYAALVDGQYAHGWGDMRAIIGSSTFALYASLFQSNGDMSLLDYLVSRLGSMRVSDKVPAVASMGQKNLAVLTAGNQPIRVPVWAEHPPDPRRVHEGWQGPDHRYRPGAGRRSACAVRCGHDQGSSPEAVVTILTAGLTGGRPVSPGNSWWWWTNG